MGVRAEVNLQLHQRHNRSIGKSFEGHAFRVYSLDEESGFTSMIPVFQE